MKFATTFLLLTSLIVALPSEDKKETTPAPPCVNTLVCKIQEQQSSKDNADKIKECEAKKEEADKAKCIYTTLGFKDDQIEKISKIQKPITTCATTSDKGLKDCTAKCTDEKKKDECTKTCTVNGATEFGKCVVEASGAKDFDLKKAGECSNKCMDDSLSKLFECDYTCNKDLYDALITKAGDNKGEKPKDDKTKEEGKDDKTKEEKPKGDKANDEKDKSGKSSAMTNFGMSSFGAMAVGTILSALLI